MNNSDNFLLKEITSIFYEIENKITALNQCSSDDFFELNEKINKNLEISNLNDCLKNVLRIIGKDCKKENIENLLKDFQTLKTHLFEMEKVLKYTIENLDKLMTDLALISVPLKNFNQNISSLKLLMANLRLLSTSQNRSPDGFNVDESFSIEKVLDKVQGVCPVIEENVFVLINHLKTLQKDIKNLKNNELNSLFGMFKLTINKVENIASQVEKREKNKLHVEILMSNFNNDLNQIITVLNNQKEINYEVERLRNTHDSIMKKLIKVDYNCDEHEITDRKLDQLKIPVVSENQISRVLQINEKYQEAVDEINTGIITNRDKIKNITQYTKCLHISFDEENDANTFESFTNKLYDLLKSYKKYTDEINIVNKVVNDLKERFEDVEMIEAAVEHKIVDKIHTGEFLIRPEKELAFNSQKVYKLYSDNHFEKNKLYKQFNKALDNTNETIKANTVLALQNGGMQFVNKFINSLEEYIKKLKFNSEGDCKKYSEIDQLSNQISNNFNNALEKVKYYEFFDATVKQVVIMLKDINTKLEDFGKNQKIELAKIDHGIEKEYIIK